MGLEQHSCVAEILEILDGDLRDGEAALTPGGDEPVGLEQRECLSDRGRADAVPLTEMLDSQLRTRHRVAGQLDVGLCWVNSWFLRDLRTSFGGKKASGIGREGGVHSLEFYPESSNVCIKL